MSAVSERLRLMLDEVKTEVERLEQERTRLVQEREAKVAEVRQDYATKLDAVASDLRTIARLERAMDTAPAAARPKPKASAAPASNRLKRPTDESLEAVLRTATELEGPFSVNELAKVAPFHATTVKTCLMWLRAEGLARAAGTRPRPEGVRSGRPSQVWALTPDGIEAAKELASPRLTAVA